MADHVRQQLRDAVLTRLTGLTTTGARVYKGRALPVGDSSIPGLMIYTATEDATDATMAFDVERRIGVVVEGVAKSSANVDDVLDTITKEVEIALSTALTLGAATTILTYQSITKDLGDGLDKPNGVVRIVFEAVLFTPVGQPDVLLGS